MMALDMNFSSPKTFFLRSLLPSHTHLRYSKSFHLRFASLKKVSFSKRRGIQIKCHQEEELEEVFENSDFLLCNLSMVNCSLRE